MKKLYEKHNYLNKDIVFINNSRIYEYDMKNAGLSLLLDYQLINKKEFDKFNSIKDKLLKNITVGNFLRNNPDINSGLMECFQDIRRIFFEENNIENSNILSIKKDAIFLINKVPIKTNFLDNCVFIKKNGYSSYINICGKEFYYDINNNSLDIKKIPKEVVKMQKDYLFKFVAECLKLKCLGQNEELFIKMLEFKNDFINFNLDINYYRSLENNNIMLQSKTGRLTYQVINVDEINNIIKDFLPINNNLSFIIEFIKNIQS